MTIVCISCGGTVTHAEGIVICSSCGQYELPFDQTIIDADVQEQMEKDDAETE